MEEIHAWIARENTNAARIRWITRIYLAVILSAGCWALTYAFFHFVAASPLTLLLYLAAGLASAFLKVRLPGITGTMSVSVLIVLLAIAELSVGEAIIVASACVAGEYLWQWKLRVRAIEVLFNISVLAFATCLSSLLFASPILRHRISEDALLLGLVTAVYFVLNTFPVALIIAITESKPLIALWRERYFWTFPYYMAGSGIVAVLHLTTGSTGWRTLIIALPIVYVIYRAYVIYLARLEGETKHAHEMVSLHMRTIEALALAIEAKDHNRNAHLTRLSVYAAALGEELGLEEPELEALRAAGILHDIGKLAVPEHILSKLGKLTPEEFEKMKIHPLVGAEILDRVQFPYPVVPIVAAHHEKWDGTGYPHGLAGEQIPLGARILSAVDCLDALASDRQYRKAFPLETAMQMVKEQSGLAFDPAVVEVLERRYRDLEEQARSAFPDPPRPEELHDDREHVGRQAAPDFLTSIAAARDEAHSLFELSQSLGSSLNLDDTFAMLGQRLHALVPHDCIAVYLIRGEELRPAHALGTDAALFGRLTIPMGEGLSGWVAQNGRPVVNGNPSVEPGYLNDPTQFSTLRSAIAVPLDGVAGRVGVLALYSRSVESFTPDHLRILLAVSSKLSLVVENGLRFQAAEDSAVTDHLTGLPNGRSLFVQLEKEVNACHRSGAPLTLLLCDLDGFKNVNDIYGHLEGNRVLREVARLLKNGCRSCDTAARMGGDEFVIVMPGADAMAAGRARARIQAAVREFGLQLLTDESLNPESLKNETLGISIGIAELKPDTRAEDLLALADRLMYTNKKERKRSAAPVTVVPVTRVARKQPGREPAAV